MISFLRCGRSTAPSIVLLFAAAAIVGPPAFAQGQKAKSATILPGGNSGKPINIEAAKLDYYDKERKLIYTGNVVATQGDSKLKSPMLTIFLAPKKTDDAQPQPATGSSSNQVQRMLAAGPVVLVQRDQIGTGDNGVYDKPSNTVVLTGNVTLSQGPNITKGDKLVYDLKSGQAVVTGKHVRSMFVPDDNKPAADSTSDAAPAPASKRPTRSSRSLD